MPLVLNGTTGVQDNSGALVLGTSVASTSGTSIDFTGIPSWVKRVTVMFNGVSTNGTSTYLVQIGDSGGIENTGYAGGSATNGGSNATSTIGFLWTTVQAAGDLSYGQMVISNLSGNTWVESATTAQIGVTRVQFSAGSKTLSATLDRVRITTTNGTDTFDAGSINILYE
jgi:hypothetical protein